MMFVSKLAMVKVLMHVVVLKADCQRKGTNNFHTGFNSGLRHQTIEQARTPEATVVTFI